MDRATERILKGPLALEIGRFGAPLALGMALQTTFNLVDAYIVAQLPREEVGPSLGALGICDQLAAVGTIVSYGVSVASGAMLSQHKGAGDQRGMERTSWNALFIVVALGLLFAVIGIGLAGPVVTGLIGAKGEVAIIATRYLRVIVGGSFTIFLLLQLTSMQRALGSAKSPAALLVLGNVLNVFLAVLFVFGDGPVPGFLGWSAKIAHALSIPRMGMVGAAWATVIARGIVLVPIVVLLFKRFSVVRPPEGRIAPDLAEVRRIAHLAWPSSAQFVLRIGAVIVVTSLVARYFTTNEDQTATTAMGLVFRLDTMAMFVAMGWGSAAQTFVGQSLGAKLPDRARRAGWITAGYDGATNVALALLIVAFGETILRVFDADDAPVSIAMLYLMAVAPSYVGLGAGVVLGNAMTGAGAARVTLVVDAAVIFTVQLPICLISLEVFHVGLQGLFWCVAATNAAFGIANAVVYGRGFWLGSGHSLAVR
jgi:putative MATE family efflux protein